VITFEVPGIPQPQGSKRHVGRGIMVESNAKTLRPWRDSVCWHARQAIGTAEPLSGPVSVRLAFRLPRPQGHYGKKGLLPSAPALPVKKPDIDKLVRACLDALGEAGVWRDDAQVVRVVASKDFGQPGMSVSLTASHGEERQQ